MQDDARRHYPGWIAALVVILLLVVVFVGANLLTNELRPQPTDQPTPTVNRISPSPR